MQLPRNFEVGKTGMTDKLQVHTVTRKVDAKTFFAVATLIFVAAHVSAKLGNICFCSKVYSTTFCSLARP